MSASVSSPEDVNLCPGTTWVILTPDESSDFLLSAYELRLQCVEAVRYKGVDTDDLSRTKDRVRWEATSQVDAQSVNSQEGIPVEFVIPETAYAVGDSWAKGQVRWILEIKAPLPGLDYYAIFGVNVRDRG